MATKKSNKGSSGNPNQKLPMNKSIPLGIQHVLAMFAGNITVPIIVAGVFGQTPEQKIFLIQMALFVAGVATVIQTVGYKDVGSRLPIIQGTSFAFIPIRLTGSDSVINSFSISNASVKISVILSLGTLFTR